MHADPRTQVPTRCSSPRPAGPACAHCIATNYEDPTRRASNGRRYPGMRWAGRGFTETRSTRLRGGTEGFANGDGPGEVRRESGGVGEDRRIGAGSGR